MKLLSEILKSKGVVINRRAERIELGKVEGGKVVFQLVYYEAMIQMIDSFDELITEINEKKKDKSSEVSSKA